VANPALPSAIWVEKEGLAPLFADAADEFRVPLYPGKGYSSLSFSRQAALEAKAGLDAGQRVVSMQWGDYDPSGCNICESLADHYRIHGAGDAEVVRVGLKAEHIDLFGLPTRPTKTSDTRAASFGDERSVELDAVAPARLKQWIQTEISGYIHQPAWQTAMADEATQRRRLRKLVASVRKASR